MAVNAPSICERDLAIVNRLVLVKHSLCRVHWKNEFFLVERKSSAKLVFPPRVVRIDLGVMLPLKHRADYCKVPDEQDGFLGS